ncbi:MAG TPA: hypothetical protein VH137_01100 [Gemmatimonadales bacterium]|jgi:allophanate hydrolase subunit 2|nr:hypothetical protein [Gemmatimonadales bacterium]
MPPHRRARVGEGKVPQTYRLDPTKAAVAQRILGTPTATATIESTLDMVVFRQELVDGTRAMQGVELTSPDALDR